MSTPSQTGGQQSSRILAALDNPAFFTASPSTPSTGDALTGLKRKLSTLEGYGTPEGVGSGSSQKRRPTAPRPGSSTIENMLAMMSGRESTAVDIQAMSALLSQGGPPGSEALGPISSTQFSLRYDTETEVRKIDIGGKDQELRMADFVTKTIDNVSDGLTVQAAMERLGLRDKKDLLPGMEVRLLPHQIIGVSWMLDQERKTPHKGGILGDDMGLGKTVQMIATMAANQPEQTDKYRTTLIVVPAALLLQWKEEIESKTNEIFSVHIHHGKDKLKTVEAMQDVDIIITTYQTLSMDFTTPSGVESEDEMEWLLENGGPIARMKWYRVITDEAQFIRNRGTRSSKAVAMLRAKYRWCLTGTPVTNTLADIYGLIRFGHFRPWNHWPDFHEYIAKVQLEDAPLAGLRAQEVLKPLLLRRTKNSELEGRPLLELPPKHIEIVTVDFSKDEREMYNQFEKKAQISLNRFIRNNTVVKNHTAVLVLILRLRQMCCHPNLVLSQTEGSEDPTLVVGSADEKEVVRANKAMGAKWVLDVKKRFLERAKAARSVFEEETVDSEDTCAVCDDLIDKGRLMGCGHEVCAECILELSNAPIAHDGIFGFGDEQTNMRIEKEFEAAVAKGLRPCPKCKKMNDLRPSHTFLSSAFEPKEEEIRHAMRWPTKQTRLPYTSTSSSGAGSKAKKPITVEDLDDFKDLSDSSDEDMPDISALLKKHDEGSGKGRGKGKNNGSDDEESESDDDMFGIIDHKKGGRQVPKAAGEKKTPTPKTPTPASKPMDDYMLATWRQGGKHVEASAKMLALINFLKEWECTGDKTICYSQWTSLLDLVEMLFARYGIQSLRYDGKMNREARETVLAQFRKHGGPRVILISTKCGGVGLNLVSANRIVNLDLSWNYASESQAYDRAHRLGQEKEVFVKRLVVRNTIEERMLQLQDTKTGLAEAALGEGTGVKLHKLSVKELKTLFGMSNNSNNQNNGAAAPNSGSE